MHRFLRAVVCAFVFALCCPAPADAQQQQPAAPTPTAAQDAGRDDADEGPCPDAMTQPDMNRCAAQEFQKADADLNRVYRLLTKDAGTAQRAKLRAAQVAWIKFRDAHCDYEAFGNKGGSIYPMVYGFCLAGVTRERTKQFEEILREAGGR